MPWPPISPCVAMRSRSTRLRRGWAVMRALRGEGFEELSIPITQLGVLVILSSVVGVLAAVMPARRAARLDVLRAIAAE